ncbi:MAG: hypothetical protein COV44_07685 [Deltaproteobacteria bacterium CG11_big_fil_rev_8_21_14_0_20_45_16]|nr:MAG: hypothetical protein COV44_07685 [Deltaproteobacteria bacterium CG11_big_fil_rev_8_21_14_0_20_45_16]
MKKFKFRFQAVEKLRRLEMEFQVKEVALAERKVLEIESQIEDRERKLREEILRLKQIDLSEIRNEVLKALSSNYREELRRQVKKLKFDALNAKAEVIRERRKLVEKQKKLRAMEVLEEKDKERYYAELNRLETQELDEISSNFWIHNSRADIE